MANSIYAEAIDSLKELGKTVCYEPAPEKLFFDKARAERYAAQHGIKGKIKELSVADLQKLAGSAAKNETASEKELRKTVEAQAQEIEALKAQLAAATEALAAASTPAV